MKAGPYVAKKGVDYHLRCLHGFEEKAKAILIRGPTGVGKSVLARLIGAGLRGEGRTLKLSSQTLKSCKEAMLKSLITGSNLLC